MPKKRPQPPDGGEIRQKVATTINIDKASKRVIAPFVRIVRKTPKLDIAEAKHFAYQLQKKPSVLIRDLSSYLSDTVDLPSILHETSDMLKVVTKAAGVTVYMMDPATNEIYQSKKTMCIDRFKIRWKIVERTTVAAHVALFKEYVMVDDLLADDRFPEGVGYESHKIKPVLCIPVVTPDGACFAVIELFKFLNDKPFCKDDLKITLIVTGWMGAAIHQNSRRLALQRQQELNDYLLDLTKCFFEEAVSMEKLISEIVTFAKVTLNAERCMVFIIDQDSGGEDLVADLFDDTFEDGTNKKVTKVRFTKERGVAALVARTGVTVNVKDAYQDPRFNKEIDQKTGFITRSIMCTPIMGSEGILGVMQVVNKKSGGSFTSTDEYLFKTFSVYSALSLRYTKAQQQLNSTKYLNNIFNKLLQLQLKPCIHDVTYCLRNIRIPIPLGFDHFTWYIKPDEQEDMPQLIIHMMMQVIDPSDLDIQDAIKYILCIRKFYRKNPFHNFEHAFNVCHTMYLILKGNRQMFRDIEVKALMLSALSHSLDHEGYTSSFLELTKNDLVYLYDNSYWENHHYYVAMFILDNNKVFNNMSSEEMVELKHEMRNAIMASDVQIFFSTLSELEKAIKEGFDWNNELHRHYVKRMMMNAADSSSIVKPFLMATRNIDNLYSELYRQGDLVKQLGQYPLSVMDRDKSFYIPEDQIILLRLMIMPCLKLLRTVLPNTEGLYNEAKLLKGNWQDIIDVRGKKCWRQDDSIVEKQYNY